MSTYRIEKAEGSDITFLVIATDRDGRETAIDIRFSGQEAAQEAVDVLTKQCGA